MDKQSFLDQFISGCVEAEVSLTEILNVDVEDLDAGDVCVTIQKRNGDIVAFNICEDVRMR